MARGKYSTSKKVEGAKSFGRANQATTAGLSWSETKEKLTITVNNKEEAPVLKPMYQRKKIVLFGSSTTDGRGSTGNNAYTKLLAAALASKGYEVSIRGFGGDSTATALARFWTDVAPLNADYCFIAFTIGNEGLYTATDKDASYQQFKNGLLQLIRLCKQHGMTPIVANQMPTQSYDATIYRYARNLNAELDAMDIHVVDWMGAVIDETTFKPITSASFDTLHVNDVGHKAIFRSIPPNLFEMAQFQYGGLIKENKGSVNIGNNTAAAYISTYVPEYSLGSYSMFVKFRATAAITAAASLLSAYDATAATVIRIQLSAAGVLTIFTEGGTDVVISGVVVADTNEHSVGVSYNSITGLIKVYFDGALVSSTATYVLGAVTAFYLGGRPGSSSFIKNYEFKNFAIYRTAQIEEKFRWMHEGVFSQTSLELLAPLNDKVLSAGALLMNLAPTPGNLKINTAATTVVSGSI